MTLEPRYAPILFLLRYLPYQRDAISLMKAVVVRTAKTSRTGSEPNRKLINIDREIQPHDAQQIGANCRVQPWRPNSQAETGNSKLHQGAVVLQPNFADKSWPVPSGFSSLAIRLRPVAQFPLTERGKYSSGSWIPRLLYSTDSGERCA